MKHTWFKQGLSILCLSFAQLSMAAVSVEEADRLKNELTPLGAEKAGNGKDIPPWRGGITLPPVDYKKSGQHHVDPFPQDRPLFTITAQNRKQYDEYLTEGQKALFEQYPRTFKMPIYQTRRTAAAPDWVYENTYKNALRAELDETGNALLYAYGGIPFPIAKNGLEVIWNHINRWRGVYLKLRATEVAVQADGKFNPSSLDIEAEFNYYRPDKSIEELDNILFYYLAEVKSPARLAGGALLVHETMNQVDQPRLAWGYNAGQRRVRRAPNLGYDTPVPTADGLRVADDTDMFNGAPNRYNWSLVGKKELYIPYNTYRVASPKLSYNDILMPGHINPEHMRYEKHRVWVVEATLKDTERHIYGKRVFYIDEDSWAIAVADQYDAQGLLWRVSMSMSRTFYEVPTTWSAGFDVFHDLQARRYHVQGMTNEEPRGADFSHEPPGARHFTPSELRRRGRR